MKPTIINGLAQPVRTEFSKMYNGVTEASLMAPDGREVYLRPSMLPVCSVSLLQALYDQALGVASEWDYGSDFFTGVGTQVHETIERWCSRSGYKLWGNWKCPECEHEWEYSSECDCPKCGTPAHYHEITIEHLGFKGHIDCILLTPTGVLIGDYKTSTLRKIGKTHFKEFNVAYALQIMVYTYMMDKVWGEYFRKHYKLDIRGCSLLFISRDNPFRNKEFHWQYNKRLKALARSVMYTGNLQFRAALRAFENGDITTTVKRKCCKSRLDYMNRIGRFYVYEPCPMLDVCFNRGDKNSLKKHFSRLMRKLKRAKQKATGEV